MAPLARIHPVHDDAQRPLDCSSEEGKGANPLELFEIKTFSLDGRLAQDECSKSGSAAFKVRVSSKEKQLTPP